MTRDQWIKGFWKRVLKLGARQCWEWQGHRVDGTYGQLKREDNKTNVYAHRASVEIHRGFPVPGSLKVLHTCDNPPCVNPAHLRVGTQRDNVLDMYSKGRGSKTSLSGDDHGSTKVSDSNVRRIRMLWRSRRVTRITQMQLASRFGVTQAQISRIVSNKRRK